ncbi:hypothetical protein Tco_0260136 [Tanacetum coccineum]
MGDKNPIRTLGDYSKPSHKGYRNTIKLLEGNNVVPLRSDTIRLVQNGCSFHGLRSEDPNQHLKDFLKLVDSLDLMLQIGIERASVYFNFPFVINLEIGLNVFQQDCLNMGGSYYSFPCLIISIKKDCKTSTHLANGKKQKSIWDDKQQNVSATPGTITSRGIHAYCDQLHPRSGREIQATQRIYGSNHGRFHASLFGSHKEVKGKDERGWEQDKKD